MKIKKKLALLLACALMTNSVSGISVSAEASNQGSEDSPATASTNLSLRIAELEPNQGNATKSATASTKLSLYIAELEANQGNESKKATGSTKLTLTIPEPETTKEPTTEPTKAPVTTTEPTKAPVTTTEPTKAPVTTTEPTKAPVSTMEPTKAPVPTTEPTKAPVTTTEPTKVPVTTTEPTKAPVSTMEPTKAPVPTTEPTKAPVTTTEPTKAPGTTTQPTNKPEVTPTATPEPTKNPETTGKYEISGKAMDEADNIIADAGIELKKGNKVLYKGKTDAEGKYKISGIEAGEYNLVLTYGDKVLSKLVSINGSSETVIEIPVVVVPEKDISSIVNVVSDNNTPEIVVGGLSEEALNYKNEIAGSGDILKLTLNVESKNETDISKDAAAIKSLSEAFNKNLEFLDMNVLKQLNDDSEKLTELKSVLEIIVPYDTAQKKNIVVFRKHGESETKALDKIAVRPIAASDYKDGTYYVGDGFVVIYTQKFSTYAIGYDKSGSSSIPVVGPSGPSYPSTTPVPTAVSTTTPEPATTPAVTAEPTTTPAEVPTEVPSTTQEPTAEPTKQPEVPAEPTTEPTEEPTVKPTKKPSVKDQSGLSGSKVSKLKLPILLAAGKGGDKKVTISWASYKGADGYDCYWSYCNGKQNFKKFATVKGTKCRAVSKNLKNNKEYKYFVAAYKIVDGKKVYIAKSNQLHVAMKSAKKTNAKAVLANKANITLKKGQTFTIKSSTKLENTSKKQLIHEDAYRYYTSDKNVASVSRNGKIKAVKKGKCVVYVIANNGVYRKIKITVK